MADSALPQLTTELSTLSLTGPALTNAVLFNRDLFLHITRFCDLGALGALSATCKVLEESVLDRQTWWHQCERLWLQPSLRSCRDPRGLCRRLKEGSTWAAPKLRSLDDLVLLIQIVKPDDEALTYEFNVGDLRRAEWPPDWSDEELYLLPGLPKLTRNPIPEDRSQEWRDYRERVNVRVLRKGTFQVVGGEMYSRVGDVALREWEAQGLRDFEGYEGPVNVEVRTLLEFERLELEQDDGLPNVHPDGGWAVKLVEHLSIARDTDPASSLDYECMDCKTQAVPWPLGTLNRIFHTRGAHALEDTDDTTATTIPD